MIMVDVRRIEVGRQHVCKNPEIRRFAHDGPELARLGSSGWGAPSPQVLSPMRPWKWRATLIQVPSRFLSAPTSMARPAGCRVPGGAHVHAGFCAASLRRATSPRCLTGDVVARVGPHGFAPSSAARSDLAGGLGRPAARAIVRVRWPGPWKRRLARLPRRPSPSARPPLRPSPSAAASAAAPFSFGAASAAAPSPSARASACAPFSFSASRCAHQAPWTRPIPRALLAELHRRRRARPASLPRRFLAGSAVRSLCLFHRAVSGLGVGDRVPVLSVAVHALAAAHRHVGPIHRVMDDLVDIVPREHGREIVEGEREARVQDLEHARHALLGREHRMKVHAVQPTREPDRSAHPGRVVDLEVQDLPAIQLRQRLFVRHVGVAVRRGRLGDARLRHHEERRCGRRGRRTERRDGRKQRAGQRLHQTAKSGKRHSGRTLT